MAPLYSDLAKKCLAVINSCKNTDQLEVAQRYIELFFKRTNNVDEFRVLISAINDKIDDLKWFYFLDK